MEKRTKNHRPNAGPFNPPRSGKAKSSPPPAGGSARPRRRKMEEALRESEKRFRTAVEAMLDGFAILSACRDKAGRIVDFRYEYINEAGCRMNGRSREDTLGRSIVEMFPALEGSEELEDFIRTAETGEPFAKEAFVYSGVFAGGEPSTRAFDVRVVKMGDGVAVSWMDVTGRRKTAEAVARLASFPELNPNPVVEVDLDGSVRYVNPAARRLFPDLEEDGSVASLAGRPGGGPRPVPARGGSSGILESSRSTGGITTRCSSTSKVCGASAFTASTSPSGSRPRRRCAGGRRSWRRCWSRCRRWCGSRTTRNVATSRATARRTSSCGFPGGRKHR